MLIHCIRHGQSTSNAEGRVQGQLDVPLSPLGLRQSAAVAEALADPSIDALYSSPLCRALETARAVAGRLRLPIRQDRRLMEIHAGVFQGQRRSDLAARFPEELAGWHSEDLDFRIPGGESRRDLMTRGSAAFREIAAAGHRQAAIVAHGRLLIVTVKNLVGLPHDAPPFALHNGSITTISFREGRFALEAIDRTDHLAGIGLGSQGDL